MLIKSNSPTVIIYRTIFHSISIGILIALITLSYPCFAQKKTQAKSGQKKPPSFWNMQVNEAVMVTVELDFGKPTPSIKDALKEIERVYRPDDGKERTFAILDAYGEILPDGKLHISMHVSSEKPGIAQLVFKRTGEILWRARIKPSEKKDAKPFSDKNLTILIEHEKGKVVTVDGSTNPSSILTAGVKELGMQVQSIWKDGAEKEVTFIYSACGCPVKVMVKRVGDKTIRTKELPVIFPDDPAVVRLIERLMRW